MSKTTLIFKKELKTLFRDKKTLITMFLPVLLYPVMILFLFGVMNIVQGNAQDEVLRLYVHSDVHEAFKAELANDPAIDVIEFQEGSGTVQTHAILEVASLGDTRSYVLQFHSNDDSSNRLRHLVERRYQQFKEAHLDSQLKPLGLDTVYKSLVTVQTEDISGDESDKFGAMLLGMILPFIVVLYGIVGTNLFSSDLSAGEKERATLETIFSVPVKRHEIITGKLLACTSVGLLSGAINLIALFPMAFALTASIPGINISISIFQFLYMFLHLLPIMVLCSALFIAVGFFANTYQESQSYASFLLILLMGLTYIYMIPDLEGNPMMYFVPITNAMLLMKEALFGNYELLPNLQVFAINIGLSIASLVAMHVVFKTDWIVFGGDRS